MHTSSSCLTAALLRRLASYACAALLTLGFTTTVAAQADLATERRAVVMRVFDDALSRGDYRVFRNSYVSSFVKHLDGATYTLEQEMEHARSTHEMSSALKMTVTAIIAQDNLYVVQWSGAAVHDRPIGSFAPTGKPISIPGITVYRFVGAKIAEEWTYFNEAHMLRQLQP